MVVSVVVGVEVERSEGRERAPARWRTARGEPAMNIPPWTRTRAASETAHAPGAETTSSCTPPSCTNSTAPPCGIDHTDCIIESRASRTSPKERPRVPAI